MNDIAKHYDILIDLNNDPVHDPEPLRAYMDKWDGQEFIEKLHLDKTKSVLEIGVGTGRLAVRVASFCNRFTGVDLSAKTIERAKENMKSFQNAVLICDDFLEIDFHETFDVIYSSLTFMHIKEKQKAVCKVFDLLNKDGIFALSVDKNRNDIIDIGESVISVFPDNPDEIKCCIENAGLILTEMYETEFAHIFIAKKEDII